MEQSGSGSKGLKANAIGFIDGLIIGIASTAPAYSLAAVLAIVVVLVGVQAPAVLLASFIPMFLIASSFYYMNRADPDCGTTFSWITRAMGPSLGWVAGWAVCTTGTIVIGLIASVWFAVLYTVSENFLFDSLTALSLMIAFYYALNGFACAIYYRRELTKSVKNFIFIGVGPVVGGAILAYLFYKAIDVYSDTDESYTGTEIAGVAVPVVLGLGRLLLGLVLMIVWRLTGHDGYFGRRREIVDPDVASGLRPGMAAVPEEAV